MKKNVLYWIPRVLGILTILFMMMFSLDCLGEGSFKNQMICLLMHNLPAFGCAVVLFVAWKWELIGGILFAVIFVGLSIFFFSVTHKFTFLLVISPFVVCSALFILHDYILKKSQIKPDNLRDENQV